MALYYNPGMPNVFAAGTPQAPAMPAVSPQLQSFIQSNPDMFRPVPGLPTVLEAPQPAPAPMPSVLQQMPQAQAVPDPVPPPSVFTPPAQGGGTVLDAAPVAVPNGQGYSGTPAPAPAPAAPMIPTPSSAAGPTLLQLAAQEGLTAMPGSNGGYLMPSDTTPADLLAANPDMLFGGPGMQALPDWLNIPGFGDWQGKPGTGNPPPVGPKPDDKPPPVTPPPNPGPPVQTALEYAMGNDRLAAIYGINNMAGSLSNYGALNMNPTNAGFATAPSNPQLYGPVNPDPQPAAGGGNNPLAGLNALTGTAFNIFNR